MSFWPALINCKDIIFISFYVVFLGTTFSCILPYNFLLCSKSLIYSSHKRAFVKCPKKDHLRTILAQFGPNRQLVSEKKIFKTFFP